MSDFFIIGDPPIEILLRRNSKAKRYSLRISNKDHKVSLTLPRSSNMREAKEFVSSQEGWIRKHLSRQLKPIPIKFGERILLDGKKVFIRRGFEKVVTFNNDSLFVPGAQEDICGKLRAFYKTLARERLMASSDYFAKLLGCKINSILFFKSFDENISSFNLSLRILPSLSKYFLPKFSEIFCRDFIVEAITKNSSRITFGENTGFTPGLIFPAIVRPYSLKHPA